MLIIPRNVETSIKLLMMMLKVLMMMTMSLMAVMRLTPVAEKLARLDWVRTTVPARCHFSVISTVKC